MTAAHHATEIVPGVWVGTYDDAPGFPGRVVCVLEDCREYPADHPALLRRDAVHVAVLDVLANRARQDCLEIVADLVEASLQQNVPILLYCGAGIERSPLAVAWWMVEDRGLTWNEAYELLKAKRGIVRDVRSWLERYA